MVAFKSNLTSGLQVFYNKLHKFTISLKLKLVSETKIQVIIVIQGVVVG